MTIAAVTVLLSSLKYAGVSANASLIITIGIGMGELTIWFPASFIRPL
jgi:hypothetical protein